MRRALPILIFSTLIIGLFISLGNWQLRRLQWKTAILADIETRIAAYPVPIPTAPNPQTDRFLPVFATGHVTGREIHVLVSTRDHGARYRIIQAFQTDQGRRILVDRGIIPLTAKESPRTNTHMRVIGNLHWPDEIDGYTPDNDLAANIWFSRDVATLAAALNTEQTLIIARNDPVPNDHITPLPVDSAGIPNRHLEYVVTWYGMALVWVVMTFYFLWHFQWRKRKNRKGMQT